MVKLSVAARESGKESERFSIIYEQNHNLPRMKLHYASMTLPPPFLFSIKLASQRPAAGLMLESSAVSGPLEKK